MNEVERALVTAKRLAFEALLPMCPYVGFLQDHPSNIAPEKEGGSVQILRYGTNPVIMGMPDLVVSDAGLSATISIGGRRMLTNVVWTSVTTIFVLDAKSNCLARLNFSVFEIPEPVAAPLPSNVLQLRRR